MWNLFKVNVVLVSSLLILDITHFSFLIFNAVQINIRLGGELALWLGQQAHNDRLVIHVGSIPNRVYSYMFGNSILKL